jgi:hypothetical protein
MLSSDKLLNNDFVQPTTYQPEVNELINDIEHQNETYITTPVNQKITTVNDVTKTTGEPVQQYQKTESSDIHYNLNGSCANGSCDFHGDSAIGNKTSLADNLHLLWRVVIDHDETVILMRLAIYI